MFTKKMNSNDYIFNCGINCSCLTGNKCNYASLSETIYNHEQTLKKSCLEILYSIGFCAILCIFGIGLCIVFGPYFPFQPSKI